MACSRPVVDRMSELVPARRSTCLAAGPTTVVAIPARNEEDRIEPCLAALLDQRDLLGHRLQAQSLSIVVLANNCTDGTAARTRAVAAKAAQRPGAPAIHVRETRFPRVQAHAGHARRTALDIAEDLAGPDPDALICSTDADSRVHPDWIARIWAEHARGADAVAGTVEFDAAEAAALAMPAARAREAEYSTLQAELIAAIDPEPHDPWPNHVWSWGASLSVTCRAYRGVGGLPRAALAEDRAFVALLGEGDFKVRHSLDVRVTTSCRTAGRAPGGLADLIAAYRDGDDTPCDAELQPVSVVLERARCRRYLRSILGTVATPAAARRLGVDRTILASALACRGFGMAWRIVEGASTRYYITRVMPADLPREIRAAKAALLRLKGHGAAGRSDKVRAATAGLWTAQALPPR